MANTNAPFGLRPVRYLNGAPWNGQVTRYLIPSTENTDIFIGDPVTLAGSAGAAGSSVNGIPTAGMPTVTIGTAGNPIVGAVVGFEVNPAALDKTYGPASTARVALVVDDPNVIFLMQEQNTGTAFLATEVSLNANFVAGTGSTATGLSGYVIDNAGEATTATLNLRLMRTAQLETNEIYTIGTVWEVLIMAHQYRAGVTGA